MRLKQALFLLCVAFSVSCSAGDPELGSPEKAVLSYCHGLTHDAGSKYFALERSAAPERKKIDLPWKSCDIVDVKPTSLAGKTMEGREILASDVEVITRVGYKDEQIAEEQYWYLLRRFGDDWKIIAYSAAREPDFTED